MKQKELGGWQFNVRVYEDYVLKTPKKRKEIEKSVKKYLYSIGKLDRLNSTVDKIIIDIKNSNIPRAFLADLEFLKNEKIKQKRVIPLKEYLEKLNETEKKNLFKDISNFILKLWEYGIHEKTFKLFSNMGFDKDSLVLIDAFELTDNKEKVLNQIEKAPWKKKQKFNKNLSESLRNYLIKELDKRLTKENLDKYWKKAYSTL